MILTSIIGDSISTYEGYNPNGYAVYYDKEKQDLNGLSSVYDTWWAQVNQAFHLYLCVNNSYSGSKVSGIDFPAGASSERINNLCTSEYTPDIILVYMGFNDFGNGVPIYNKGLQKFKGKDLSVFSDAYKHMISSIKTLYPNTKIVCGTLMRSKIKGNETWIFPESYAKVRFEDYNTTIKKCAKKLNCYLADLSALNIRYETLDGSHPTKLGHTDMAHAWIVCLSKLKII